MKIGPVLLGQTPLLVHEGSGLRALSRPAGYKVMRGLAPRSSKAPSVLANAKPPAFVPFKQGP